MIPRRALGASRRAPHRLALVIVVKLGVVVLVLTLPSWLAVSVGAAHVLVFLLILAVGAATFLVRRRRGGTPRPVHRPHGH